jgi:hypothetical protein
MRPAALVEGALTAAEQRTAAAVRNPSENGGECDVNRCEDRQLRKKRQELTAMKCISKT